CAGHPTRRLPSVYTRRRAAYPSPSEDLLMNSARRPPLQHPLAPLFARAVDSFSAALSPETIRYYHGAARNFLSYLGANHPEVNRLDQLRREPHILGWMSRLHSQVPPLATASYILRLIALRPITGRSTCHSASSTPSAWSPWTPLCVSLSNASDSFVSLIRCLPMDSSWPVRAPETRSFVTFVITYIRSAIRSAFPPASSRIN